MEKYLSIGEVVKMKGVSHRSLRHYDTLGILVPAYVNKETGYRYYSKNQMLILDIILLCVAFDIPLKEFHNYRLVDGSIDAQKLVEDATQKAVAMQQSLEQKLYFLQSVQSHFVDAKEAVTQGEVYTKNIQERYFLTTPAPKEIGTWADYWTNMTKLYSLALKNTLSMSVNQGVCFCMKNSAMEARYYLEVKRPEKYDSSIIVVPDGVFTCEMFDDHCLLEALEKYVTHEYYRAGNMLIFNDVLEQTISNKSVPFEVQLMMG